MGPLIHVSLVTLTKSNAGLDLICNLWLKLFILTASLVSFTLLLLTRKFCLLRIPPHCDVESDGTPAEKPTGQTVASKAFCIYFGSGGTSFEYTWPFSEVIHSSISGLDPTCLEAQHLSFCTTIIAHGVHEKGQA